MTPYVLWKLPDGSVAQTCAGDIIGRQWTCSVVLSDERVSIAHAMVVIRGGAFRLLTLRGGVAIGGSLVSDPILERGLTLEFAPGLALTVTEVRLPEFALALAGPGLEPTDVFGVCSLVLSPTVRLRRGHRANADAWLFDDGSAWFATSPSGVRQGPLSAGDDVIVGDWTGTLVKRELPQGLAATLATSSDYEPLRIESYFDAVRIFQTGKLVTQLAGNGARILAELLEIGQPIAWEAVAGEIWPDAKDRWVLRNRWDTALKRLRTHLAKSGLRSDLVCSDGTGQIAAVLYPTDAFVDAA